MKSGTNTGLIESIDALTSLSNEEREKRRAAADRFPVQITPYYLSLIESDSSHTLERIVIPDARELDGSGKLDASNEESNRVMEGVQHKYKETLLVQVSADCLQNCRYCFRKRVFINGDKPEVANDIPLLIKYVRKHPEIQNVLLTGGDAFLAPQDRLEEIIANLREIPHVEEIRLGTREPVVDPERNMGDSPLINMLSRYSLPDKKVYVMTHFIHPLELTPLATEGITNMQSKGLIVYSQAPLIRGVNDTSEVLIDLFNGLSSRGVTPHYIFQCRPTEGNAAYAVPVEKGYGEFRKAQTEVSGLGKKARFAMSHASGKIEVVGMDERFIYMQYSRAKNPIDYRREMMTFLKTPNATWFDQYAGREYRVAPPTTILSEGHKAG